MAPLISAQTLQNWGLGEYAASAAHQEDWSYEHEGPTDYVDILIVAHLHQRLIVRETQDLPRLEDIPAFTQLKHLGLTAAAGVTLLQEAQKELEELRTLLS